MRVQVSEPYIRTGSMVDLNRLIFRSFGRFDRQILSILLHAFQASAFLVEKSFAESMMNEPRYLKSWTCLSNVPLLADMVGLTLLDMNSVFEALQ